MTGRRSLLLSAFLSVLLASLGFASPCAAQTPAAPEAAEDPAHAEIRALRDGMLAAWDKRDLDTLSGYLAENIVITWQNGEVTRGKSGLKGFYEKMMLGETRAVDSVTSKLEVDDLAILYGGDTAVAFGKIHDDFVLRGGRPFPLDSRWTATLVKQDGKWLLAAYSVSANLFDNPVLAAATGTLGKASLASAAGGILAGVIAAWILFRKKK